MSLILTRLSACSIDPVAQVQKQLFQLPADSVNFVLDTERALHLFIVNDKSATTRRFYAVNHELVKEMGDAVRQFTFVPFRSELGAVGIMQVNLQSKDGYSVAKRQVLELDAKVFSVTRLADTYEFTASTDADIEPVTDAELESILTLVFADSIVESREHPVFKKYASPSTPTKENNEKHEEEQKSVHIVSLSSNDDFLNIDLDNINDLL